MQRRYCRILLLLAALAAPAHAATPNDDIPSMARKVKGFDLSLLAPVAGVTLRQVGEASYYFGFVPTLTKDQVLADIEAQDNHL